MATKYLSLPRNTQIRKPNIQIENIKPLQKLGKE
jgi:hypothetical protein